MSHEYSQSETNWRTALVIMAGAGIVQVFWVAALALFLAEITLSQF